MHKLKKINLNNLINIYIILCPILDIISFLYRNIFNKSYSPSTIIRPIIPICIFIILFFKEKNKKNKIIVGIIYFIYTIIHLLIFKKYHNGSSYGNILNEFQYIVNYTFLVVNIYNFKNILKDREKIEKSVFISLSIYIVSLFISIITKTSSSTYIEGIGFKGYFESGNSLCTVILLEIIILLGNLNIRKWKEILLIIYAGIYLCFFSGMRTGLYGFGLTLAMFIIFKSFIGIRDSIKLNKRQIITIITGIILVFILIIVFGSKTLERRKMLKETEKNNLDPTTNIQRHVTGDILEIYKKIQNNELDENYMSKEEQNAIIDLYNISEKIELSNVNLRIQQLIYNVCLIKEQKNIVTILFGNGYKNQTGELVMEMEVPAIICNFGIIGITLYLGPVFLIFINSLYILIKKWKFIKFNNLMYLFGITLAIMLSTFSGYVFFNFSSMTFAILLLRFFNEEKVYENKQSIV